MPHNKILFIEDDASLAKGLIFNIEAEGYMVDHYSSIEEMGDLNLAQYSLLILDRMLPGKSGLSFLKEIRDNKNMLPVLVLSAKGSSEEIVEGLQNGADDYIPKPFNLAILLAKIHSLIRTRRWLQNEVENLNSTNIIEFGGNKIDFEKNQSFNQKGEVLLTYKEIQIMRILLEAEGDVVSREFFLKEVWGIETKIITRTLDNYIVQLRKKFEVNPKKPKHILKVHGQGYRFSKNK
jgi:DNA-binding response OmpR family regulator